MVDTPGHEVFSFIRNLIIKICDIVVILISVEDGIQEQTLEIIRKTENKSKIIAITKIDKMHNENAKQKIYNELAGRGILIEDMGGHVFSQTISSKNNTGISDLIEKNSYSK